MTHADTDSEFVTDAQPTRAGTAPAAPPMTMFCALRGFSQIV